MNQSSVQHDTFTIERDYPVKPERVFEFFSDPKKKRLWLGGDDEGFQIESFQPNFAVQQFERWKFRFQGGDLIANDVCYQDIVPNRRVVFVYTMTFGDKRVSSSQTTIVFIPTATGTRLVHTEQGAFFDGMDQAAGRKHGTEGLLDKLGALLSR